MAGNGTTLSTLAAAAARPLKKTVADGITIEPREASDLLEAANAACEIENAQNRVVPLGTIYGRQFVHGSPGGLS